MSFDRTVLGILVCLALFAPVSALQSEPSATFQGLGDFPGGIFQSKAFGVSDDGRFVVGSSLTATTQEAFRWSREQGMVGLGFIPGGYISVALDVSRDGGVVCGWANQPSGPNQAFVWTLAGGLVNIGSLGTGSVADSTARGVSADGSVVVGDTIVGDTTTHDFSRQAFRWTSGQMAPLGNLAERVVSIAIGISANGQVIVGEGDGPLFGVEAVYWTQSTGLVNLQWGEFATAVAASRDGRVIVGRLGNQAVRWTALTGLVGLGDIFGGTFNSGARGCSGDGAIVVGFGNGSTPTGGTRLEAFIWTAETGMQKVSDYLTQRGAQGLQGWVLSTAWAISADGTTIVGEGRNPDGNTEAWVATIPPSCQLSGPDLMAGYPESKRVADLDDRFESRVSSFLSALHGARSPSGLPNPARVRIAETLRTPARAYLMRYAYLVANQFMNPELVPPPDEVSPPILDLGDVCWLHSDDPDPYASVVAAQQMLSTCCPSGIAKPGPAYPSNHQFGTAIDMSIRWQGTLVITDGNGRDVTISSLPRNGGGNKELWKVGASYGVLKLGTDAPHWSSDGH